MKIIHLVLGKANPDRMNGVNKVAHQLVKHQHQLGFDVTLWGITANPVHDYPSRNYPTRLFQPARSPFVNSKELKKAIAEVEPSTIFHIHGGFIPLFFAVARTLHQHKIAFIYTPHGAYNTAAINRSWLKKTLYFNIFERSILRWCKAVHLLGQSEMTALGSGVAAGKKVLISNGQEWRHVVSAVPSDRLCPRFVFCGRLLAREKGIDLMLEGFARFTQALHSRCELWILGNGPDDKAVKEKSSELGLSGKVTFFGSRFGEEKDILLRQCDAHVLFSRNEGMPMAVLEAAAMRLPSIVSPETNMGDFITSYNAGIALQENTPDAIAKALTQCAEDFRAGIWYIRGLNAQKMVQEAFDWDQIAMRLCEIYRS